MAVRCKTPGCKVAETGKCIEGFPAGECPHLIEIEDTEEELPKPSMALTVEPIEISIPTGKVLTLEEATDVLRCGQSRVLTVIGPSYSGKTTFTLSLYDAFQHGAFGDWDFAGSLTLPGFEMRCHFSRAASGSTKARTPRSLLTEGLGFLHLDLYRYAKHMNVLISERSGEHYERVSDNVEDAAELHEVKRADALLFFVDGKKLASDSDRFGIKTEIVGMVRSLMESGIIAVGHRIAIVLTKMDFVTKSPLRERCMSDFDDLLDKLRKIFHTEQDIAVFHIAARSEEADIPHRYGVVELLRHCLDVPPPAAYEPSPGSVPDRHFLKFGSNRGGTA